jgi:hypothetical protein
MIVLLVHWLIKKGREREFEARWHKMTIARDAGLYREILTTIADDVDNPRYHTFSVGDPHYTTYINVGLWPSVAHFDAAVSKYIPEPVETKKEDGRTAYAIELEGFEFKLRERVVLKVVSDRGGSLPDAALSE